MKTIIIFSTFIFILLYICTSYEQFKSINSQIEQKVWECEQMYRQCADDCNIEPNIQDSIHIGNECVNSCLLSMNIYHSSCPY